jgi:hypothetical protein
MNKIDRAVVMWTRAVAVKQRGVCKRSAQLVHHVHSLHEPLLWVTPSGVIHRKWRLTIGLITIGTYRIYSVQDSLCVKARQFMRKTAVKARQFMR